MKPGTNIPNDKYYRFRNEYKFKDYASLLVEAGIDKSEAKGRIEEIFNRMFFDPVEKIYFEMGPDMGYMLDTGNYDAVPRV